MKESDVCELIGALPYEAKELVEKLVKHLAVNCTRASDEDSARYLTSFSTNSLAS